jgi:hypothetical protein
MIKTMNLKLHITKNYNIKDYNKPAHIRIAVIDQDKSLTYPQNFLCLLPKQVNPKLKQKHKFVELFGDKSPQLAHDLLISASETEKDPEIGEAIRKRLLKLNYKSTPEAKCRLCGQTFQPKGEYGPTRMCQECRQRIYAIQKSH